MTPVIQLLIKALLILVLVAGAILVGVPSSVAVIFIPGSFMLWEWWNGKV